MKHTSVKLNTPCEFINITPMNPLISKCQIKVCYVGDEPNRNKSIITKDVAREMANSLPEAQLQDSLTKLVATLRSTTAVLILLMELLLLEIQQDLMVLLI